MKTTFTIEADTKAMRVELRITQGSRLKYRKQFTTVTEAAAFMLDGIATVMERQAKEDGEPMLTKAIAESKSKIWREDT